MQSAMVEGIGRGIGRGRVRVSVSVSVSDTEFWVPFVHRNIIELD